MLRRSKSSGFLMQASWGSVSSWVFLGSFSMKLVSRFLGCVSYLLQLLKCLSDWKFTKMDSLVCLDLFFKRNIVSERYQEYSRRPVSFPSVCVFALDMQTNGVVSLVSGSDLLAALRHGLELQPAMGSATMFCSFYFELTRHSSGCDQCHYNWRNL